MKYTLKLFFLTLLSAPVLSLCSAQAQTLSAQENSASHTQNNQARFQFFKYQRPAQSDRPTGFRLLPARYKLNRSAPLFPLIPMGSPPPPAVTSLNGMTGVRSDAAMRKKQFKVEENKPADERGRYLAPAAFDQPEEKGVEWALYPELMKQRKERREAAQKQPQQ